MSTDIEELSPEEVATLTGSIVPSPLALGEIMTLWPRVQFVNEVSKRDWLKTYRTAGEYHRDVVNLTPLSSLFPAFIPLVDKLHVADHFVLMEPIGRLLIVVPSDCPRRDGIKLLEPHIYEVWIGICIAH